MSKAKINKGCFGHKRRTKDSVMRVK